MKKLSVVLVMLCLIGCTAATVNQLRSQHVVDLPGMKKEQIFNKSNQWVATTFRSANAAIQYKDLKEGKIICQIVTSTTYMLVETLYKTTMTIDIKDGKSRIIMLAHEIAPSPDNPSGGVIYGDSKSIELVQNSFKPVIDSYKDYMSGASKKSDDNW